MDKTWFKMHIDTQILGDWFITLKFNFDDNGPTFAIEISYSNKFFVR